jgi:hypothetical protein
MPTDHIIALLIEERDKLNRAIEALQGAPTHAVRTQKNSAAADVPLRGAAPAKQKRRSFTPAQRRQQAERMRQYWAAKKAAPTVGKKKAAKAA